MITLYDRGTIDQLIWPDTYDGQYARNFLYPLIREGAKYYIDNVQTDLRVLKLGDLILPITINEAEYHNSYVCSPYGQYFAYTLEELHVLKNRSAKALIKALLVSLGQLLKIGKINKVVIVNNWLLSTNLYPKISQENVQAITRFLQQQFPNHFIMWRSLNACLYQPIMQVMDELGYYKIAGRLIYIYGENVKTKKDIKKDKQLCSTGNYEIVPVTEVKHAPRIEQLYHQLYCEKYSKFNPQFNCRFFELAINKQILQLKAVQKNGEMQAVLGYFTRNQVMTTPCVGYDLAVSQTEGLYRRLSNIKICDAEKLGVTLHGSSGAGTFKKNRGAEAHVEYNLFMDRHLPLYRRFVLKVLHWLINTVGLPLLKKYG